MSKTTFGASRVTTAMILAASLVGLITGYTIPLISIELSKQSVDTFTIGILSALPAVGMMFSCFATPALSRLFKMTWLIALSLGILTLSTIVSCITTDVYALVLPRILTGFSSGILVVLGESWVTGRASTRHRATLTGLYTSTFTGCQLIGPLILAGGHALQTIMLTGVGLIALLCMAMLHRTAASLETESTTSVRWCELSGFLPVLASGVFCFSFFDSSMLSLFPLYGIEQGLNEKYALTLVTIILVGDALFQVPIGYFADRIGVTKVHRLSGLIFCSMITLFPFLFRSPTLLIIGCLTLGAFAGALYTLSLVQAGKLLTGQKLIMMNAILGLVWSAGSISGPVLSGASVSLVGYNGMIGVLLVMGLAFVVLQKFRTPTYSQINTQLMEPEPSTDISYPRTE
ncbi:MFS transporter [Vibrio vulnificus]|uniref:MFS transporter n=1 Tax=Vibrio vulnificus TaxID=672 RepID=UPI000CD168EF|nr:MFS transporter [Vibrio vulnificus]EIO3981836.1 MFS transporter [Vibrio vulnificus]EJC6733618.1 MFS transporter [Vibrio vulnificus]ELH9430950.1 MFS transporter [Vibrio vulnificus]POC50251.1 MFS transporter [Vibrio vulnificus]RZQ91740.1 MFS transporter [Vibrio vulnificus]